MRTKHFILFLLPVLALLSLASTSYGLVRVYDVKFDVWTEQLPGAAAPDHQLWGSVKVAETREMRGPDALNWTKPFTVKAPNGDVFNLDVTNWDEPTGVFVLKVPVTSFTGGVIPAGKYTVSLTDTAGAMRIASDTLPSPVGFLAIPTVTAPLDNTTVASLTPTLTWNAVSGAMVYRLEMMAVGTNDAWTFPPLYSNPHTQKEVYGTSFAMPLGVLKSNTHYVLRIEAKDSDKNVSKRSRSIWVHFTTPPSS